MFDLESAFYAIHTNKPRKGFISLTNNMKIAVAGKGGTGKTTVITLLATYLAEKGHVLAFDVDTNENLASSLGFSNKEIKDLDKIRNYSSDIFEYTKTEVDWKKRSFLPHKEADYYFFENGKMDPFLKKVSKTHGNVSVSHLGNVDEEKRGVENMCESFTLMRIFLNHLRVGQKDSVLVDLAAGNDLLTRATIINMDEVLLVVEPTSKNLLVAKDILISLKALHFEKVFVIVNKSFRESDLVLVSNKLEIDTEYIRRIPFSSEILEIDNKNKLNFKSAPKEAKKAIEEIYKIMKINKNRTALAERASKLDKKFFQEYL